MGIFSPLRTWVDDFPIPYYLEMSWELQVTPLELRVAHEFRPLFCHQKKRTLPETNVAPENPHFSW